MKKLVVLIMVCCLAASFTLVGCGAKKAATTQDAINTAEGMATVKEKTDYLVGQAKTFYSSKEFQGAIDIAQYVLRYLDKDSAAAKSILQKAQDDITALLKKKAEEAKKSLPKLG